MTAAQLKKFQTTVLAYYETHGRHDLPWRIPDKDGFKAYKILISETMLQQTQVARVVPKYGQFLQLFPNVEALAEASQGAVLTAWSGLGYNRRARYLHRAAQAIANDYNGKLPNNVTDLTKLPGIGVNTAGAVVVYAFNQPVIFIETNIRSVYIEHFFKDSKVPISDKAILELVELTIDKNNPREWYWGLMDYGSHLKQTIGNGAVRSAHYKRQSVFSGSKRQIRGQVIKQLAIAPHSKGQLERLIPDERLEAVLADLINEKLIHKSPNGYTL